MESSSASPRLADTPISVSYTHLYYLEVRQVFLDPKLSLKKLSEMIETNQTYQMCIRDSYDTASCSNYLVGYHSEC